MPPTGRSAGARLSKLGALAAACALALGACDANVDPDRGDARQGGSITVALAAPPDSLDPALAASPAALQALWLVHTPLLTYARAEGAAGTKLVPALARELPDFSPDGRTVTFALRPGLRYSDGRHVRAGDFERAVKRALRLHPRGRELFGGVLGGRRYARTLLPDADLRGISADERTGEVRIRLVDPDPAFLFTLAAPVAAPVPGGTPVEDTPLRPPPGVGPYRLAAPRRGIAFVLARRRDFRLPGVPAGNVDEVAGKLVEDSAGATRGAVEGLLDAVQGEPPVELLPRIRSELKQRYEEHPTLALDYVKMDPGGPFADEDLRRAVSFALDEAALARLRDGFLEPSCNVLPPQVAGHERLDPCPYGEREENSDLVRARELVESTEQRPERLLVAVANGPRARIGARDQALERYLVATLRKIGLRARPARTARERARAQIRTARRLPAYPHPARYLEVGADQVLDTRISLLELEGDPRASAARWAELDREAVQDADVAPYGIETSGVLLSERMDPQNCSRFHPVFGLDWSSLCLR